MDKIEIMFFSLSKKEKDEFKEYGVVANSFNPTRHVKYKDRIKNQCLQHPIIMPKTLFLVK